MYFVSGKLSWFCTLVLIESLIIFQRKPLVGQGIAEKIGSLSLFLWGEKNSFIRPAVASLSWQGQNIFHDLSGENEWGLKTQCHCSKTCHLVSQQLTYLGFFTDRKCFLGPLSQTVTLTLIWHIMDHLLPNWHSVQWESTQENILQLWCHFRQSIPSPFQPHRFKLSSFEELGLVIIL